MAPSRHRKAVPLRVDGSGRHPSKAERQGDLVLRTAGPWSPSVVALLRHLESAGFAGAPRVVGSGFAADGREVISFIPGSSPQPYAWADDAVARIGELLRDAHVAARSFAPPSDAVWQPWFGRGLRGAHPVYGHCDTGPWNVIARDGQPVALVDWEFAGPVDAIWELAQACWLNAQLHDDNVAEMFGLPDAPSRARQAALILDGYGLSIRDRVGFVDRMVEFAVRSARDEAIQYGVALDTTSAQSPQGFPVMWSIAWRARSAAWMLDNRHLLRGAVEHSGSR